MAETVVISSCYFPPILFFSEIFKAKNIVIDIHEYFIKQTLRNRAYICNAEGKMPLIVPVRHTGGKLTPVKDIMLSYDAGWQKNHWRSITSAYRNSPWFEFMEDDIAPFFTRKEKFLCDLNERIFNTLLRLCGITANVTKSEGYVKDYPGHHIDLRNLSDIKYFEKVNLANPPLQYNQVFTGRLGFTGGLSILDLLFNEGKNTLAYLAGRSG